MHKFKKILIQVFDRYMFKMDIPIETGCEMGKKRGPKRGPNCFFGSLVWLTLCGQRQTGHEMENRGH